MLRRTFGIEALLCPRCHGRMQLLAVIEDEAVARRILLHLHLPARAPPRGSPWRPQSSLALEATPGPSEDIDPPAMVD